MLTTTSDVARPASTAVLTDIDRLGDAIATLAARLHAATYELLVLLREFDRRAGWNNGFVSCAHWLHWRTGIDLGAALAKSRRMLIRRRSSELREARRGSGAPAETERRVQRRE